MSVVLITGCSSGFGLEAALSFARRGDTTVATMRKPDKAGALRERAAQESLDVEIERLDVCDEASVAECVGAVLDRHGPVDVLVNNAGIGNTGSIETQDLANARRVLDTNFWGAVAITRAVLPAMRGQRSGVIINVSSLASRIPGTMYSGMYAASKAALNAVSESLAGEVAPLGIRVVSIEPGFFKTAIQDNDISADEPVSEIYGADQEWLRSFFEAGGSEGHANPTVVAEAIVAAASDTETPLHVPVGDDAAMYLGLLDQVDGYEGWMDAVLPIVEGTVGPRPAPA
jgi:NAD(P)-dependent dehydrogenase (short-subunit alcohol dehydrogenase family)